MPPKRGLGKHSPLLLSGQFFSKMLSRDYHRIIKKYSLRFCVLARAKMSNKEQTSRGKTTRIFENDGCKQQLIEELIEKLV
jgi:hypothetical protein